MKANAPLIFAIALFSMILIAILHRVLVLRFRRHLSTARPDEWLRLTGTTQGLNQGIGRQWQLTRYLFSGEFRQLGDEGVNRIGTRLRIATVAYSVVFLLAITSFLVAMFS